MKTNLQVLLLSVALLAVGLGWFVDRQHQKAETSAFERKISLIVEGSKWVSSARSQLARTSEGSLVNGPSAIDQGELQSIGIVYFLALHQGEVDEYLELANPKDVDQSLHSARTLAARLLAETDCGSFERFVELCQKLDPSATELPTSGPRQEDLKVFVDDALSAVPVIEILRAENGKTFTPNQTLTE